MVSLQWTCSVVIIFLQGLVPLPISSTFQQMFYFATAGSLFTFGAGPSNTTIEALVAIDTNSTAAPNSSTSSSAATSSPITTTITTTADIGTVNGEDSHTVGRWRRRLEIHVRSNVLCQSVVLLQQEFCMTSTGEVLFSTRLLNRLSWNLVEGWVREEPITS